MTVLINRLTRDHRRFGRIMTLLDALVARFHGGDEPNYELMCEMLEYVVDYADQVHHPSEELLFARLTEVLQTAEHEPRADAVALTAVVNECRAQHQRLQEMNHAFRDALEGIVQGEVLSRDAVAEQGRAMIGLLRTHCADEETRLFPVARDLLSTQDWAQLEQQAPNATDPVFGQLDPLRFQTLYDHLKDELDTEDAE
ncbi:hemerythrin domain-containing protein [Rhabdochromatium marinum]|uniref:hemerythrin domain-containing protein n=1 Tax=Rhabdochromatium marinum TaxID=48729 RepID=UPI0019055E6D|nr:hemerythrin domain-containing protein [Rhabdochromatium marinum]MBK1647873.1 hypothetical protein [Rhabdochromatium marinum]